MSPVWRHGLDAIGTYGNHIFYRTRELAAGLSLARASEAHMQQLSSRRNDGPLDGAQPAPVSDPIALPALPDAASIPSRPVRAARVEHAARSRPAASAEPEWMRRVRDHAN